MGNHESKQRAYPGRRSQARCAPGYARPSLRDLEHIGCWNAESFGDGPSPPRFVLHAPLPRFSRMANSTASSEESFGDHPSVLSFSVE